MSFLKDIITVLIGLIALTTAIVVYRTKIIEHQSAKAKVASDAPVPAATTQASAAMNAGGGSVWRWRWALFFMMAKLMVYLLGLGYLLTSYFGASGQAREFYFVAVILALMISYQDAGR
jgi:hypothetical protein